MKLEKLNNFLKKESDRIWTKRGGISKDLPEPHLELTRKERLEEIRRKYDMREKLRQRKIKSRMTKKRPSNLLGDNGDVTLKLG